MPMIPSLYPQVVRNPSASHADREGTWYGVVDAEAWNAIIVSHDEEVPTPSGRRGDAFLGGTLIEHHPRITYIYPTAEAAIEALERARHHAKEMYLKVGRFQVSKGTFDLLMDYFTIFRTITF